MENGMSIKKIKHIVDEHKKQIEAAKKHLEEIKASEKPAPKPGKEEDGITIKSSTPGSDKRFRITVDDNGVISAVEVK